MNKLFLYIVVFLALALCFYYFKSERLYRENITLEAKKNELAVKLSDKEKEIAKYNEKQVEATKQITTIREKIKYVKEDCDCYNARIPVAVINSVQGK